jgi:hypothetical protein
MRVSREAETLDELSSSYELTICDASLLLIRSRLITLNQGQTNNSMTTCEIHRLPSASRREPTSASASCHLATCR